jgi:hypothetical protein
MAANGECVLVKRPVQRTEGVGGSGEAVMLDIVALRDDNGCQRCIDFQAVALVSALMKAPESETEPKTPPCILIIFIAA